MTLVCGLILVAGFFWGANRHFSVMEYAIKNAKLRREKENLEAEQRRLYLTREISLSPTEIKKAARKIGLQDLTPENIEVMVPDNIAESPKTDVPVPVENTKSVENTKDVKEAKEYKEIAKSNWGNKKTENKKEEKVLKTKEIKSVVKKEETVKVATEKREEKIEKKFDKNGDKSNTLKTGETRSRIARN